ncbi:MAG: hypothetical protein COA58_13830 [Bacteroidetes bacterium]|nr:MAG: hypothetical protein COA58_13830 [Bacteroidota bacterium]
MKSIMTINIFELKMKWSYFTLFLFVMISCTNNKTERMESHNMAKDAWINQDESSSLSKLSIKRKTQIINSLNTKEPFLKLPTDNTIKNKVQNIIALDPKLKSFTSDPETGKPYLVEMFEIEKASAGDISNKVKYNENLYHGLLYNFARNSTLKVTVNVKTAQIADINFYENFQPNLNAQHSKLAIDIAMHSDEVIKALGFKPEEKDALMAATKTALNKTKCERSMHLCCAPTFIKGNKALWAIVDLTDLRLLGIRWTNLGQTRPLERISERNLLIDKVEECNCKEITTIEKGHWKLDYILTKSDGLRVSDAFYKGKRVLDNAKLVDWHVSYSNSDGFGYSDAIGCPEYSQAAVSAVDEAKVADLFDDEQKIGFVLEQTFKSKLWPQPCNYNYLQRFEFYDDGRFRMAVGSLGRGCGTDATYRPVSRIVLAGEKQHFAQWDAGNWRTWRLEGWNLEKETSGKKESKYLYKLGSNTNSFYIEPSHGQFNDGGRGDFAYTYITQLNSKDEGQSDLMTIGPCCNTNHTQGPEKFINSESIRNKKLVLWYVPRLKNDGVKGREYCWAESYLENGTYKTRTFPCMSGAMFVPVK